ncbi:MAG: hypothetical protein J07HQW2_03386 [Haloquadratum walsbyi J07HQW2]|uniref:Uncharacterized protein n=1 Tax=Haloquadratum walsbyi J07HQW2 TaxID=1238425 RepID=U1PSZ1_9EURY|nr:MAG: hypothetical protein J07HQW2_03386 [Haloquadratum walsbyi J07HQW2]
MQCSALPCPTAGKYKQVTPSLSKSAGVPEANPTKPTSGSPYLTEEKRGVPGAWHSQRQQSCPTTLHSPRHSPRTLHVHAHAHGFSPCQGSVGWGGVGLQPCNLQRSRSGFLRVNSEEDVKTDEPSVGGDDDGVRGFAQLLKNSLLMASRSPSRHIIQIWRQLLANIFVSSRVIILCIHQIS